MDGLTIARECIAQEAAEKTGILDLGRLGLSELPDELFKLKHLRRLNLGRTYFDGGGRWYETPRILGRTLSRHHFTSWLTWVGSSIWR